MAKITTIQTQIKQLNDKTDDLERDLKICELALATTMEKINSGNTPRKYFSSAVVNIYTKYGMAIPPSEYSDFFVKDMIAVLKGNVEYEAKRLNRLICELEELKVKQIPKK